MSFHSEILLIFLYKSTSIVLSCSKNSLVYGILKAPCVVIPNTLYVEVYNLGECNFATISLLLFSYVWLKIVHSKFFIFMFVIVSAEGLYTLNFTSTVSIPFFTTSVESISAKSASFTSGNSIYHVWHYTWHY